MASTAQILRALTSGDRLALVIALNPKAADVIARDGGFGGQFMDDLDVSQVLLGGLLAAADISAHYDDADAVGALDKAMTCWRKPPSAGRG